MHVTIIETMKYLALCFVLLWGESTAKYYPNTDNQACFKIVYILQSKNEIEIYFTFKAMVQLFEWKWTDIATECEQFLSNYGYGAIQVNSFYKWEY